MSDSKDTSSLPQIPPLPWHQRLNLMSISALLFLGAALASMSAMKGSGRELDYWQNLKRFVYRCLPPDFSVSADAFKALGETIQISVLATFFAILIAFPIAIAAASNLSPLWLRSIVRLFMNANRTVHVLLWALLAVVLVGPNPLAGVIALTFYSLGYLCKFYSDSLESLDMKTAEALRANGAGLIQVFQYALWPQAKPFIWSYAIWMLEYNIRSATVIGYVGAGGIGLLLHSFQEYGHWDKFAAVLLIILVPVTLLDFLGERIRNKITGVARLKQ
ncbi:MAG TPA: phosphonate ABC transporter, permease protein PhnE [Planctomycetota bacterium]|nr:phosphonate ABC transporter, permease protein PhnE [Planctomycetota bacterium]